MKAGQLLGVPVELREKLDEMLPSNGLGNGLAGTTVEVLARVAEDTTTDSVVVTDFVGSSLLESCAAAARFNNCRCSTSSFESTTHLPSTNVGTPESTINVSRCCGGDVAAALKTKETSNIMSDAHCSRSGR